MTDQMNKQIKKLGGTIETEETDKMLVKYRSTITLPIAGTEIVGTGDAPSEDAAVSWAMYDLKLKLEEVTEVYPKLFGDYEEPTGLYRFAWVRRMLGGS